MIKQNSIQVIVFRKINETYEFLILKRISERGGFWQPITGRVEKNETLEEASIREIKEETNIKTIKRIIKNVHKYFHENNPGIEEFVFGIEINPTTKINLAKNIYLEHDEIKWVSFEEAMRLLKWPQNKKALKKLNKLLK